MSQTKLLAGLNNSRPDFLTFLVGTPNLQAGSAGHTMTQGANLASRNVDDPHIEKLDVRIRATVQLFDKLLSIRSLNLVAVTNTSDRLPHRTRGRPVVIYHFNIVAACLGMKSNPVGSWCPPHEKQSILLQMEKNSIANHIAIVATRHKMLGFVNGEVLETIDRQIGEQFEGIGTLNIYIHHMVRLIVKNASLPPGQLFVTPICELGRDHGIDIGAYLRIS